MKKFRLSGYWLSPVVHPATSGPLLKQSSKKKKVAKMGNKSSGWFWNIFESSINISFFSACS